MASKFIEFSKWHQENCDRKDKRDLDWLLEDRADNEWQKKSLRLYMSAHL